MTDKRLMGAIAATRFGLGAREGEIEDAARDPVGWTLAQTAPTAAPTWVGLPHSAELLGEIWRLEDVEPALARRAPWFDGVNREEQLHRVRHMVETDAPFRERWAMFWRNHFALKVDGAYVPLIAGAFAREALDPHLFGRFEDMAAAAARHPAMQLSLDQSQSVGPNSAVGRTSDRGLNENLARETLELHTVGVRGGYTQADVAELAKVLTGWSVGGRRTALQGRFFNDPARREPGPRRVLGRSWPESEGRAEQVVRALAREPATGARLAHKLARHFVADEPPGALVERLRRAWARSEGDLQVVAQTLIGSPEGWVREQRKFKTPAEFVVSVHRAAGSLPEAPEGVIGGLQAMGQMWLCARTPDGWSDEASAWTTPQGLALRAQYAWTHAHRAAASDSRRFVDTALGGLAQRSTRGAVAVGAAGDRASAFALVAMSPEFQRR